MFVSQGEDNFIFLTEAPSTGSLIKHLFRKRFPGCGELLPCGCNCPSFESFSRRLISFFETKRLGGGSVASDGSIDGEQGEEEKRKKNDGSFSLKLVVGGLL